MTRLLVSVRDTEEAQIALDQEVDLIDVKEPLAGPLGAASFETIAAVSARIGDRVPLSAALGELLDTALAADALAGVIQYAKFGMAGCGSRPDWADRWRRAVERLPSTIQPVAVVYADWRRAHAPQPADILRRAAELGCGALLVDTFDKSQGSLEQHLWSDQLARFIAAVRSAGMLCVIAGGLGRREIEQVLPLGPDFVAVRGAACRGDRTGRLDPTRVRQLVRLVRGGVRPSKLQVAE